MTEAQTKRKAFFEISIGGAFAILITLILFFAFAILMNMLDLGNAWAKPATEISRVISILVGCFFGIKHVQKSIFKGLFIGLFYGILSIVIFSILDMRVGFELMYLLDIAFSVIIGSVGGGVVALIKK